MATRSPELTLGMFVGGFLIDLDHYFDYFAFNGQRDMRPASFLRYYSELHFERVVLPLHAYELMACLALVNLYFPHLFLVGYLIGAAMHLGLDLIFNQGVVGSTLRFYSFLYRARHGFAKARLLRPEAVEAARAASQQASIKPSRPAPAESL